MIILVANIGSTSFKYRLFAMPDTVLGEGRIERIGGGECPDYATAIARCTGEIAGPGRALESLGELSAVAFKAVHAGPLGGARRIDDEVLAAMEEFAFFAPAHNPPYIAAMRAFRRALPGVPLVALFETAFFDGLDEAAVTYAVPYSWKTEMGVRRYGFHGASHRAAAERAQQLLGGRGLRHISCHLGGSSSMAAIRGGAAIDTSFGISPQSGLPHHNRTGDLDVFAALYVMRKRGLSADQMAAALASESGLAGISGTSGDIRDVSRAAAAGEARARLALDVFVRAIRHYLGAFLVELGGLDILTFSGGIGENSGEIRAAACRSLESFGIVLDSGRNASARGESRISADGSPAAVWIVPADEERVVAQAAARVLTSDNSSQQ
ncbi:MAG: acetate/propionate family kinase [Acidobacteriia bacterium]|nr:acetate/propionate family kinase [Terriglobia bacterium]